MKQQFFARSYVLEAALFLSTLLLFTFGLINQEVTSFDTRFYLFAKEMLQNGLSWFPTTYGQPYPDYPVASTVLIYLSAKLFGGLNKFTAVVPSAMAAAWTVVLTYRIGALQTRKWGLAAVSLMLMTLMLLKCARSISLDVFPMMFTAWCFYLIYKAERQQTSVSLKLYLLLAFSFTFRGPIGLVMPAGVVCGYYFLNAEWKKLFLFGISTSLLLFAGTAILFFIAHHVGGMSFLQDVIRMQFAGRINNDYQPLYFYFTNSIGNYSLSYPLACVVIVGLLFGYAKQDKESRDLLIKLSGWMIIILVGMSIPGDKKARYILPMVPAIALMAAYPLAQRIKTMKGILILFFAALLLDAIYIKAVEPKLITNDSSANLVAKVESIRYVTGQSLIFYRENPDGTPIKYQIHSFRGDIPVFINTESQLLNYKQPAIFITSEEYFKQLTPTLLKHFTILMRGKLGHVSMVVFERKA